MIDRELTHVHGRFQPFHREHLDYAAWAADGADELLVGITNADPSHVVAEDADPTRDDPKHNPFRYHERHRMVHAAVDAAEFDCPVRVLPFPINRPELWDDYAPPDAIHYVNVLEEWHEVKVRRLRAQGRTVVTKRGTRTMSGTDIRSRMSEDEPWEQFVPDAVARVLRDVDAVERVQELYGGDP